MGAFSITGVELTAPRGKGKLTALASKYGSKLSGKIASKVDLMKWKKKTQTALKGNHYYLMVGTLTLAVLFLAFAIFSQFRAAEKNQVQFQTSTGGMVQLTIDDLKKEVFAFKTLDPTSDEKSHKYSEILQKLSVIEQQGLWQEDVLELKKMLNQDYEKGFLINTITSLSQFDDEQTSRKTSILAFNPSEKTKL